MSITSPQWVDSREEKPFLTGEHKDGRNFRRNHRGGGSFCQDGETCSRYHMYRREQ